MRCVDAIALHLKSLNARVYGGAGGTLVPFFDACHKADVEVIITRTEQGASFAAQGAYKSSGRPQFCCATSGPGATNLVTGIADCYYDSSAVVFITGQVALSNLVGLGRQFGFQQTPMVEISKPITKLSVMPLFSADAVDVFKAMIDLSMQPRRGPVLLDLCMDIGRGEM